jgi:hypothetical protein
MVWKLYTVDNRYDSIIFVCTIFPEHYFVRYTNASTCQAWSTTLFYWSSLRLEIQIWYWNQLYLAFIYWSNRNEDHLDHFAIT